MRWHYRDAPLVWLFAPAYVAHLAEEFWGGPGFPAWFAQVAGAPLPVVAFVAINAVAFTLLVVGSAIAVRREQQGWIAIAIATVVSVNALLHLAGSVVTRSYSPGLITGIVLYLPLGQLVLIRAVHQVDRGQFTKGIVAGMAIHALVSVIAATAARAS
jgi:Protein of unknown function with HXXEE motif